MTRRYRIHPAIGIARLGNSPDFFVGPETPGVPANWDDDAGAHRSFRDAKGRILRQGARFRVFEYSDSDGGAKTESREIVPGGEVVDIEWTVHLANRKASFFAFEGLFGAQDAYATRDKLRNANVEGDARVERLEIDPGARVIGQKNRAPVELVNDKKHIPIRSLGTLRLDDEGRLIVLGGYGESNSTESPPRQLRDYANNDTWFDDASDGPISARVYFSDGSVVEADTAWLFVGPPDFAPSIGHVVSLRDTLWDTAVREVALPATSDGGAMTARLIAQKDAWSKSGGRSLAGYQPSFTDEIYPLLARALDVRHVHVSGAGTERYHQKTMTDWVALAALTGEPSKKGAKLRKGIFGFMRDPDDPEVKWDMMPRGFGDDYAALDKGKPTNKSFLSVTRIQYALLRQWSEGSFVDDWPGHVPRVRQKSSPTAEDLDRAATDAAVGGPFCPGIEVSWLIRTPEVFSDPLRIVHPRARARVGGLAFRAGFFSQQMALPWQADFYDCRKEQKKDPEGNEYHFMWWTAARPDDVFPSSGGEQVRWVRTFDAQATTANPDSLQNFERFHQMQRRWSELKFVSVKKGDRFEEEP